MRKVRFLSLLVAGAFVAGACGDDNGGGVTGDTLSDAEVDEVFEALSAVGGGLVPIFSKTSGGPLASPIPVNQSINESEACPEGGSVQVTGDVDGTVDDATFESDLSFDLDENLNGCAVQTESMKIFTIDGSISISGNLMIASASASGTLSWDGSFDWESDDGRSGGCGYKADLSFSTSSGSFSGTVCGKSVSASYSG